MNNYDDKDLEEILKLIDELFGDVEDISSDTFHVFNINDIIKGTKTENELLN